MTRLPEGLQANIIYLYTQLKIYHYQEINVIMDVWTRFVYICRQEKWLADVMNRVI